MAVDPVTPNPGLASLVTIGGTPVVVAPGGVAGGFITNPVDAGDQGLPDSENLYIDPVGNATIAGNGTTFALAPGQSWPIIPGQTTPTSVNAPSAGHKFSVVYLTPAGP